MLIEDLLRELPSLSEEELRSVVVQAEFLLQASSGTTSSKTGGRFEEELYQAVKMRLTERSVGVPPLRSILAKSSNGWTSSSRAIEAFVTTEFRPHSRTETIALLSFLLERLLGWMDARSIPVVITSVLANLGRIPGILEADFPGYRTAGLLPTVLRTLLGKAERRLET